jgi:hypothetical protein
MCKDLGRNKLEGETGGEEMNLKDKIVGVLAILILGFVIFCFTRTSVNIPCWMLTCQHFDTNSSEIEALIMRCCLK